MGRSNANNWILARNLNVKDEFAWQTEMMPALLTLSSDYVAIPPPVSSRPMDANIRRVAVVCIGCDACSSSIHTNVQFKVSTNKSLHRKVYLNFSEWDSSCYQHQSTIALWYSPRHSNAREYLPLKICIFNLTENASMFSIFWMTIQHCNVFIRC